MAAGALSAELRPPHPPHGPRPATRSCCSGPEHAVMCQGKMQCLGCMSHLWCLPAFTDFFFESITRLPGCSESGHTSGQPEGRGSVRCSGRELTAPMAGGPACAESERPAVSSEMLLASHRAPGRGCPQCSVWLCALRSWRSRDCSPRTPPAGAAGGLAHRGRAVVT